MEMVAIIICISHSEEKARESAFCQNRYVRYRSILISIEFLLVSYRIYMQNWLFVFWFLIVRKKYTRRLSE